MKKTKKLLTADEIDHNTNDFAFIAPVVFVNKPGTDDQSVVPVLHVDTRLYKIQHTDIIPSTNIPYSDPHNPDEFHGTVSLDTAIEIVNACNK